MDLVLLPEGNMLDMVKLTISERDLMLISLCLLVAHDHAKGNSLRSDIESLQTKLTHYQPALKALRGKRAGCGEECQCQTVT